MGGQLRSDRRQSYGQVPSQTRGLSVFFIYDCLLICCKGGISKTQPERRKKEDRRLKILIIGPIAFAFRGHISENFEGLAITAVETIEEGQKAWKSQLSSGNAFNIVIASYYYGCDNVTLVSPVELFEEIFEDKFETRLVGLALSSDQIGELENISGLAVISVRDGKSRREWLMLHLTSLLAGAVGVTKKITCGQEVVCV